MKYISRGYGCLILAAEGRYLIPTAAVHVNLQHHISLADTSAGEHPTNLDNKRVN